MISLPPHPASRLLHHSWEFKLSFKVSGSLQFVFLIECHLYLCELLLSAKTRRHSCPLAVLPLTRHEPKSRDQHPYMLIAYCLIPVFKTGNFFNCSIYLMVTMHQLHHIDDGFLIWPTPFTIRCSICPRGARDAQTVALASRRVF